MIFDFTGRFSAAFNFIPGSAIGAVVDEIAPIKVGVYVANEGKFENVTLRRDVSGKEEKYDFAYNSISDDYKDVFATSPMLSLKRAKKLVITPIDNSDIEVVERYGTEPWEVTWRGLLIDMENHEFPIDKMEKLNEIFEVNGVWTVDGEILNKVGVKAIYIKDISIEFVEGYEDTISYTLTARAIKDLEYQLTTK